MFRCVVNTILDFVFIKSRLSILAIFGGHMLGVKSISGLAFYDWETLDLVRRIEIQPKHVSSTLGCSFAFLFISIHCGSEIKGFESLYELTHKNTKKLNVHIKPVS